jgi:DUF438 domain-containing protein
MIENLSQAQISGILEALPVDITFVDENDTVRFWNKHESRAMKRPASVLGSNVRDCHPTASLEKFDALMADFKSGKKDCLEYQVKVRSKTFSIKNMALRDTDGKYIGTVEIDQDITEFLKK